MATEADVPEVISIVTGEAVDRSLKIEKLDRTDNQCSPGTLNESKGDLDQHPEIHTEKHFVDGENVQVEYSMEVESKNNSFGISEGEHFLDPLSEISQVEQSNQAGMEIPKNELQLQKGTQVGRPVETGTEERKKFAEDIENDDIVIGAGIISEITKTGDAKLDVEEVEASTNETTVDQHVQFILNQQDSIEEDVRCLEKEADISDADIKGVEKADGNAESYHKEASDLLEATTFQEYEASSTHDVTNSSFKKDIQLETNVTSNDEKDSQQTLQNYEQKEELQALPERTPEDSKTESAFENVEAISCTEKTRAIQNTPEFLEKEEANHVHCSKKNDSITDEVSVATSIEQGTVEHALPEIQTAENQPQEYSEEKSRDYQASVEAALTDKDEKNLEEQAIQERSSSLVEEETSQQISREEEEVQATNLKEEEKEADTKCEEPIEVAHTTTEIGFETIEQRTETNKDLYVPIPKEEAYAEESTKAFVEDNSVLSEVSKVKTKEIIQEDHSTVTGDGLVSGEVSQVLALEEAKAENKEHVNNTPEQKGPQTILTDETVVETKDYAQVGENYNSETIEKDNQTAENEKNADAGIAPDEGLATIVPDQPALHIEDIEQVPVSDIASEEKDPETTFTDETALDGKDTNGKAERDLSSEENLEKQLPVVEDKSDTCLKEAEEEKQQETQTIIITHEPPVDIEVIDVQVEDSFSPEKKLEELIPKAADEGDTCLKEAEEENKEQVKSTDSAPEEKVTILTDVRALENEEFGLQVVENVGSKDNVEEQIPTTADEGDTGLKEPEEDNKELVNVIDISPDEKGLATILTDETTHDTKDIDAEAKYIEPESCSMKLQEENKEKFTYTDSFPEGKIVNLQEKLEEQVQVVADEGDTCLNEAEEENKEKVTYTDISPEEKIVNLQEQLEEQVQVVADEGDTCLNETEENKEIIKSNETTPEEKGLPIISTDGTTLDNEEIELQSEENVSSTDNLEKHIPSPADEAECGLTEAESEYKEQVSITDITPEVNNEPTIFTDQTALESEEIELRAEEDVTLTYNLEKELPPTTDEGQDILTEAKAESKEQVTITDITQEKGIETILTDERSLETEDINVQATESANSNENLVEEISEAPELGDTCLKKEDEEENKEQVERSCHQEKGLATILTEETSQELEYTDIKAIEHVNSEEILEKHIPTAVYEGETDMREVEAENKEQVETTELAPKEKGLPTILADETTEGIVIDVQAGGINSKEVLEKQIPTPLDEGEMDSREVEADIKEQVETTDIVPDKKCVETILTDERALDLEDPVQEQENLNLNENLESQISTTVGEGETELNGGEVENKEVKCTEIAAEVKGVTTILRDETALEIQDVEVKAEEKLKEAGKGEETGEVLDDLPVNFHNTELVDEAKSEDNPERNHITVEEVLDERKITSQDFNEEQNTEGNVSSSKPESIVEDTVKSSQNNEKETIELKGEGSYTVNTIEENASDHIREYIPEDESEQIKDEDYNVVKSENEILDDSQTIEVHETWDIEKSEEILSTLPMKYDEIQQGEGCSPSSTKALEEENINEDTLYVQVAKDDGTSCAVTITKTSAEVPLNDEKGSLEVLQKYEQEENITKLPDVEHEGTTPEPSSENGEVVTYTKEEIQESLNISSAEVLETATTEALLENQIAEDSAETATKLQACVQTTEMSTNGEKENLEEQTISEEEKKTEGHVECKDSIEEAKFETLEDIEGPKPILEEENNISYSLETSQKEIEKEIHKEYSSTIRSLDIDAPEEKDNKSIDACNTELVGEVVEPSLQVKTLAEQAATKLEVEAETNISNNEICDEVFDEQKITDKEFNEEQIIDGIVTNLTTETVEKHELIKDYQGKETEIEKLDKEGSGAEDIKEDNANDISTECVPDDIDENLKECIEEVVESKEQITHDNVETLTPESINEDTVKNSQDSETTKLKEEGSCKEGIKEGNASELSTDFKGDALKSEEEIFEDPQTLGVNENSTCQTLNVERSEETASKLPVVHLLLQKQVQENINEDTFSVHETKDGDDGAVIATKTRADAPSNDEDDSPQVLQVSETEEELTKLLDVLPKETKPESSTENAQVVTSGNEASGNEETQYLDQEKDTKESDTSTREACIGEKDEQTAQEEEKKEAHEECITASEVSEISNKTLVEDGLVSLEASDKVIEKDIQGECSSIVRSLDSEVVSDGKGLTEAGEQVESTHIAPEEGTECTDIYNGELVGESIAEPSPQVQTHEAVAEPVSKVEDVTDKSYDHPEKSDNICEEVLHEPKITDRVFLEKQIREENVTSFASGSVEEENVKDDQADEKEREAIKDSNAIDISTEHVPEVIVEECTEEAVECREEVLEESQEDEVSVTERTEEVTSREVGVSDLALEKLNSDAPDEETKDGFAVIPKLDPESLDELVKEKIVADQTLPEGVSIRQLQFRSTALLPEEKELDASEYEHETKRVDKNIEEENPKEVEVPADENKQESFSATPTETCLHTESALPKLDAGETEEIKGTSETVTKSDPQSVAAASGDDIVADQTVCEEMTETPLSEERELGASEPALEKLAAVDIEEIKEGPQGVPKLDSGLIEVVSNDETLNKGTIKEQFQSPSSTFLPEEKEHETSEPEHETTAQDKSAEQECIKGVQVSADEDMQALSATRTVEKECLQKEEPSEQLDASDTEESNGTVEKVSTSDFPSIVADPKEEITVDETLSEGVTDIPLEEKEPKASELDIEKLDADTPEEVKGSEVILQSVSQSRCEVSEDEIIADQLEIPSSALLSDEKELEASEHEHETLIDKKNPEDENLKEVKEPTDEASEYVSSKEKTCLQTEEPSELEVPELPLEKLEANEAAAVKGTSETVSESDSQSINAVSKDDSVADQTHSDVITDMPLDIPSYTSLPNENEEVKEDVTDLPTEKSDIDGTEEVKKGSEVTPKSDLQSIDVVVNDDIITDHVLPESTTKKQLLVQSSTLLPEEKELKETEHEHGTATQDDKNLEEEYAKETEVAADEDTRNVFLTSSEEATNLQKEDSRELRISELSPECEEEITATFESTDAVSKEETIAEQLLHQHDEELLASPTLVPKEDEYEEATVHTEELEECKVLELPLKGQTEEETKEAFEPAPDISSRSIGELATDEIVDQIPPSSLIYEKRCENTTTINNAGEESMDVVETPNDESRKDPNSAEVSIPNEEPRKLNMSDLEFPSSQYTERDSSKEEKNLEVASSDSRAEDSCKTPIEANQTAKIEVPQEIKDEKKVAKDSQLISVEEENVREIQELNESREEKYPEEKNDTYTAPTECHHEVPGSWIGDIEKEVKPYDKSFKDHSPDEAQGKIQETATHLGLENEGDEINCGSSMTEVTIPVAKDSSMEITEGVQGVGEANGTSQDTNQLQKEAHATNIPSSKGDALNIFQDSKLEDTKPSNDTLVARETKEENFCESGTEAVDSTSAQISLSQQLMEESTKERMKTVAHLTEEKEPNLQADDEEEEEHENVEEAKTDEEKEDNEHKRAYQGYDEPVIVEASRDTEVKVSPKKSNNILSGMGKSVKHSISKVKKAIIGKSSTSKTQSEK